MKDDLQLSYEKCEHTQVWKVSVWMSVSQINAKYSVSQKQILQKSASMLKFC